MAGLTSDPKNTKTEFVGGLANVNPEGASAEDYKKLKSSIDEATEALAHRYDNPNWFKVAAGFAKPQLGGFLASLGSASEAMGENIEQQRENIEPVARMRVLSTQAEIGMNQRMQQKDLWNQIREEIKAGKYPTPERLASVKALGPATEIAAAVDSLMPSVKERMGMAITAGTAARELPELQNSMTNTAIALADPSKTETERAELIAARDSSLSGAKPPNVDPKYWEQLPVADKVREAAKYQNAQTERGLSEEDRLKRSADMALPVLTNGAEIRDLALGKGLPDVIDKDGIKRNGMQQMGMLLDIFGGNNSYDVLAKAINDGKFGELGAKIDAYVRQYKFSPESKAQFEKLAMELANNQVNFASTQVTPTDASRKMSYAAHPGITNSQLGLVGMIDMMGYKARSDIDAYSYLREATRKGIDTRGDQFYRSFLKLKSDQEKQLRRVATGVVGQNLPWFFDVDRNPDATPQESKPSSPSATQPSVSGGFAAQILERAKGLK